MPPKPPLKPKPPPKMLAKPPAAKPGLKVSPAKPSGGPTKTAIPSKSLEATKADKNVHSEAPKVSNVGSKGLQPTKELGQAKTPSLSTTLVDSGKAGLQSKSATDEVINRSKDAPAGPALVPLTLGTAIPVALGVLEGANPLVKGGSSMDREAPFYAVNPHTGIPMPQAALGARGAGPGRVGLPPPGALEGVDIWLPYMDAASTAAPSRQAFPAGLPFAKAVGAHRMAGTHTQGLQGQERFTQIPGSTQVFDFTVPQGVPPMAGMSFPLQNGLQVPGKSEFKMPPVSVQSAAEGAEVTYGGLSMIPNMPMVFNDSGMNTSPGVEPSSNASNSVGIQLPPGVAQGGKLAENDLQALLGSGVMELLHPDVISELAAADIPDEDVSVSASEVGAPLLFGVKATLPTSAGAVKGAAQPPPAKPKPGAKGAPPSKGPPGKPGTKKPPPGLKGPPPKKAARTGAGGPIKIKPKRLAWDPVEDSSGTVFSRVYHEGFANLPLDDVQQAFVAQPKKSEEMEGKKKAQKTTAIRLIPDAKRHYTMNIALNKFKKMTFLELRDAVLDLDTNKLSVEDMGVLEKILPEKEDEVAVQEFIKSGGDLTKMDIPEQFVAAMLGVPLLKQRLATAQFIAGFDASVVDVQIPTDRLESALRSIRDSEKLRRLLLAILKVGNILNETDIPGFKLNVLDKLDAIKTTSTPIRAFTDYITDLLWDHDRECLKAREELAACESIDDKADMEGIETNINSLEAGLARLKQAMETSAKTNASSADKDPLERIIAAFMKDKAAEIPQLREAVQRVKDLFIVVAKLFGETDQSIAKLKPVKFVRDVFSFARLMDGKCRAKQDKISRELKRKAR